MVRSFSWEPPDPARFWPIQLEWPHQRWTLGRNASTWNGLLRSFPLGRPGFYVFLDSQDQPLYIGKARCLRSRLKTHLREGNHLGPKGLRKDTVAASSVFLGGCLDEFGALVWERELISTWRPLWNKAHKPPLRRWLWLVEITRGKPGFRMVSAPTGPWEKRWGPFRGGRFTSALKMALNLPESELETRDTRKLLRAFLEGETREYLAWVQKKANSLTIEGPVGDLPEAHSQLEALKRYEKWRVRKKQAESWSGYLPISSQGAKAWGVSTLSLNPYLYQIMSGRVLGVTSPGEGLHRNELGDLKQDSDKELFWDRSGGLEAQLVNAWLLRFSDRAQNFVFAQTASLSRTPLSA